MNWITSGFSKLIHGSTSDIHDELLEKSGITVINKNEVLIEKTGLLATTGTGKFYRGTYKNETISIKIIDISKGFEMITEFCYWNEYKNHENILKFYGAYTDNRQGFLIFENFTCTLDQALNGKFIKDDQKIKIAQDILNILKTLQKGKKIHRDFRPGNFGFNQERRIKLLDFGFLIRDELYNKEFVEKYRPKYCAPQNIKNTDFIDMSCDIWSYGCILLDLYSNIHPIYKINITVSEIIQKKNFPQIPKDITGLLQDIIIRCLERDYEKRISFPELEQIFYVFYNSNLKINDQKKTSIVSSELNQINNYINELDDKITKVNILVTEELMDKTMNLKKDLIYSNEIIYKKITDNDHLIKSQLNQIVNSRLEFVNVFHDKILKNTLDMQQTYGLCMQDTVDALNSISEMRTSINSLSQLENPNLYRNLYDNLIQNRNQLTEIVKKYTDIKDFDKIAQMYDENLNLLNLFNEYCSVEETYFNDIKIFLKKHQEEYFRKAKIKELSDILNINLTEDLTQSKLGIVYAKVQENSNLVIIFDYDEKIFRHEQTNYNFNCKCYSIYDNQYIYFSGGLDEYDNEVNTFQTLKISSSLNTFHFDLSNFPDMIEARYSHSMIMFHDYIIIVSGMNTKSCEIYDLNRRINRPFPSLPELSPNSALTIINEEYLFCFSGSKSFNSTDGIYRISLINLDKIIFSGNEELSDILYWEEINYSFREPRTRLKRGMTAIPSKDCIYILGGFDCDNFYNNIYTVSCEKRFNINDLKDENHNEQGMINDISVQQEKIKKEIRTFSNTEELFIDEENISLPNQTFFNSNFFRKNEKIILVDGFNNGLDIDISTLEINYYT